MNGHWKPRSEKQDSQVRLHSLPPEREISLMEDPKESLRRYFTMSEQASSEALNRIEVLVEALRELLPGFKEEYSRQTKLQGERRVGQARHISDSPHRADQLIQTFQQLFGR